MSAYNLINLIYLMSLIIFFYSAKKNTVKNAILEVLVTFILAFGFEAFNIENGHYSYPNTYFYFGSVPISIILGWYTLFMIGKFWTQFILSYNKDLQNNTSVVPINIIITSFISATLGLLIDPLATRLKWWEWYEASPYLNVPIGEIFGMFIAISIISTVYWLLVWILSSTTEFHIPVVFTKQEKIDFLMIGLYQFICLLLLIWTIDYAINDNDVLMGATVTYLATQIVLVIGLAQIISSKDIKKFLQNLNKIEGKFLELIMGLGFIFSFLLFGSAIYSLNNIGFIFPAIQSIHMILIQFSIVGFMITSSIFLLYRTERLR